MLKKWQISALESIEGWDEFLANANNAAEKKQLLLEMARNGEPRPRSQKHYLAGALNSYIGKSNNSYDPEFDKKIRKLAPHWFVSTAAKNKKLLLEMARNGKPRPVQTTQLGSALNSYTKGCCDLVFDKKIRELAPHWFDTTARNKEALLEMARSGEPRPNCKKNPLGKRLVRYIGKSSGSYDPAFDKEIRKLAPHWFVDTAAEKKQLLLEMARNGEPRPTKNPLKSALNNYLCEASGCCDPVFDKKIRKLAPHWFVDTAAENKKLLLEMARNGEPRPNSKNGSLGNCLVRYTNNTSSYDKEFDKKIRKLAPHWFRKNHA